MTELNPFLVGQPAVTVLRHVRITAAGEVVIEDANDLVRLEGQPFPEPDTTLDYTVGSAGGVSDIFCVCAPTENFDTTVVADTAAVPAGRTRC